MIKRQVETNNKQVQTIIHCYPFILTSNNDLVNVSCNRSSQTVASSRFDKPNSDLYPLLEFTPYQLIVEGAVKEIDLPRKSLLHWRSQQSLTQLSAFNNRLPEKNQHKVYKSSLKKINYTFSQTSSMSLPDETRTSKDTDTQTDISVTPHILNIDEVANVFAEVAMQTTITCLPAASVSTILPQLKANLIHERVIPFDPAKARNTPEASEHSSLKWQIREIGSFSGIEKIHIDIEKIENQEQGMQEIDEDTEDTDEFVETFEHVENDVEPISDYISVDKITVLKDSINNRNITTSFKDDRSTSLETDNIISDLLSFESKITSSEDSIDDKNRLNSTAQNKYAFSQAENSMKQLLTLIENKAIGLKESNDNRNTMISFKQNSSLQVDNNMEELLSSDESKTTNFEESIDDEDRLSLLEQNKNLFLQADNRNNNFEGSFDNKSRLSSVEQNGYVFSEVENNVKKLLSPNKSNFEVSIDNKNTPTSFKQNIKLSSPVDNNMKDLLSFDESKTNNFKESIGDKNTLITMEQNTNLFLHDNTTKQGLLFNESKISNFEESIDNEDELTLSDQEKKSSLQSENNMDDKLLDEINITNFDDFIKQSHNISLQDQLIVNSKSSLYTQKSEELRKDPFQLDQLKLFQLQVNRLEFEQSGHLLEQTEFQENRSVEHTEENLEHYEDSLNYYEEYVDQTNENLQQYELDSLEQTEETYDNETSQPNGENSDPHETSLGYDKDNDKNLEGNSEQNLGSSQENPQPGEILENILESSRENLESGLQPGKENLENNEQNLENNEQNLENIELDEGTENPDSEPIETETNEVKQEKTADENIIESNSDEAKQNETDEKDPTTDKNGVEKQIIFKTNNCSCGSNALRKMADQFRTQSLTVNLTPPTLLSNVKLEECIAEAFNTTMSVLQSEMAKLLDILSDNEDIASTSCSCVDSPLTAKDTVKVTVDDQRNTLQIKINQYTDIDELHITRSAPGDHVGHKSNHVECECHPTHSGAAPQYLFGQQNASSSSYKRIKPRGPVMPSQTTSIKTCCNKVSSHQSKIPTPSGRKCCSLIREKQSIHKENDFRDRNKTCCNDKSTGVQTELTLGDRLQSESLNSLLECSSNRMPWNNISLPPPGTYNIKSIGKKCRSAKETLVRIQEPVTCRSCGPHTEIPWNDILLPQPNLFKNTFSQASCSCRTSDSNLQGKLSKPSITIRVASSEMSYKNPLMASKIKARNPSNVPDVQQKNKTTITIKIVGLENTEVIKEMSLKPGDNSMTLNLNEIHNKPLPEKTKTEVEPPEEIKEELEKSKSNNINDSQIENKEKDTESLFAPAECICKDTMKPSTFKPDPVMKAMETCEAEMKPLRQALEELQMKVRNLNIPELKGCMCTVALEEYSKCVSTIGTGRPDPACIPHIEEPSELNTFGPCAFFKPARFYVPEISLPFGRLPPPVLTPRNHIDLNAPASYNQDNINVGKNKHICTCKKRKHTSQKHDKYLNTHKKTKPKPCDAHTNTGEMYENIPKCCMYFSTLEMNSPFLYKNNANSSENGTTTKLQKQQMSLIKSKEESSYDTDDIDHDNEHKHKHHSNKHHKDKQKHKKKKYPITTHIKKYDFDSLGPYHNVFDVQNLRPGQAVKTDPNDFLLPSSESMYLDDFPSPHSLWSSIFSKTASK